MGYESVSDKQVVYCKCAKTGSAGIETRVSVFSQLNLSDQRVSNEKRIPMVVRMVRLTVSH